MCPPSCSRPSFGIFGGRSKVIIEASAGKVLICYPNPGCEEIVRHGLGGFVTERSDVGSLISAMKQVVEVTNARYEQICREACHVAQTHFDEQLVVERYLSVLQTHVLRASQP